MEDTSVFFIVRNDADGDAICDLMRTHCVQIRAAGKAQKQKVKEEEAELAALRGPDIAVSEHGVGGVTALAADFAKETGAVGERLFDVTQSFVKKAPKECQLKVSQMSVQLFTGDRVHASWMYTTLSNWEYSKSKKTIAFTSKKGSTASGVADTVSLGVASDEIGLAVLDLMVHTPDAPP
jgi:hypothetical protein